MIELWQAVALALIQGVTEFLPISSSAHLILPTLLLGWPDQGLAFDVAVHLGTLTAVVLYFRRELWGLARGLGEAVATRQGNPASREVFCLAIATLPAVVSGFLLAGVMDSLRTIPVLATTTIVFGLLLALADRRGSAVATAAVVNWRMALLIGLAQAIAPIPGTSRSGITITAGLLLGLSRHSAARFSFLMSIPVIFGAALLQFMELMASPVPVDWSLLATATLVAALSAYACIALFLGFIERIGLMPFVVYRVLLGLLLFGLWWR